MAIYTKRGDRGRTSLYDCANAQRKRVVKSSARIEAIGAIDELNSYLGVCLSLTSVKDLEKNLKSIQKDLFTIGSILAGSKLRFFRSRTFNLERKIDKMEKKLPVLKNFILPGGSVFASRLQYSRALTRRAERKVVALSEVETVKPQILMYLNRLSDFLFILARKVNDNLMVNEEVWPGK